MTLARREAESPARLRPTEGGRAPHNLPSRAAKGRLGSDPIEVSRALYSGTMTTSDDGSRPGSLPDHPAMSSADLLARTRTGDVRAWETLCARFVPILQAWALVRSPAGNTLPDVGAIVRSILDRIELVAGTGQREGFFYFTLRQEVGRHLSQPVLPQVAPGRLAAYERRLLELDTFEREAIVLHLELQRDFETIAVDLAVSSADEARRIFEKACLKLAKEMGHEH